MGVVEGYDSELTAYYRQKNVFNSISDTWKEAPDNEVETYRWKDGDYFINGDQVLEAPKGDIQINSTNVEMTQYNLRKTATLAEGQDGEGQGGQTSVTPLEITVPVEITNGEVVYSNVPDRGYLNGKTFVIDAWLEITKEGYIRPFNFNTDENGEAEYKIIAYIDPYSEEVES